MRMLGGILGKASNSNDDEKFDATYYTLINRHFHSQIDDWPCSLSRSWVHL